MRGGGAGKCAEIGCGAKIFMFSGLATCLVSLCLPTAIPIGIAPAELDLSCLSVVVGKLTIFLPLSSSIRLEI